MAEYLKSIAAEWKNGDETTKSTIYVSKLQAAVLDVEGVVDISGTTLNGSSANLVLNWNPDSGIGRGDSIVNEFLMPNVIHYFPPAHCKHRGI